jgi:hypothetical protein
MRVEWNSYISPVGTLTVVEGPDGPLVVEFPTKNARTNWADRLRKRNRDVTIDIGPCQRLTTWLALGRLLPPRAIPSGRVAPSHHHSVWEDL